MAHTIGVMRAEIDPLTRIPETDRDPSGHAERCWLDATGSYRPAGESVVKTSLINVVVVDASMRRSGKQRA